MPTSLPLPIDKSSPIALYYQLAKILENAIRGGTLAPGTTLNDEVELAARLRISRPTVRKALDQLVDAGLVVRQRRVGTYVTTANQPRAS
ncbi:GntR family transcriptional regulator [Kocuria rosea]|uniref:GntR family transcriptional regulator n=1 Tax=Kocuria rosea TaxID=1275 RepID=UPI002B253D6A|nr:GntR family transcriptional regulator [Kocuria rosea]MEB2529146.1 GntR family transcriptional regulator [Kocuria rosea]MEB2619657.1 GntR family transcriptional regulator [Kocuria rosea]